MKVLDLNRKPYQLDARASIYPMRSESACKSKIQYSCGQLLKDRFPNDIILEEIYVAPAKCYIDFFIPNRKMAFEIHGRQHDEFVPHFHKSEKGFKHAQTKDAGKALFCQINGIELYVVRSVEEMREVLGLPIMEQ